MRLDTETILSPASVQSDVADKTCILADFQQILKDGIVAAQNGDRASARRLLFQASGIDPNCEDVWMWLASISEYPEELLIFLGNALEINPENERAIEWRASTRSLLARQFVQRAAAAHQEGSMERAGQCVEQALAFDPECALAWLWKASLSEDENEKVVFLEKVLEIEPENADAKGALDAILTGRSKAAFDEVRTAATAGRRKKALELVNEFLRAEPNIADAWILRSHLAIGLDEKIESLERALDIDPDNATARSSYEFLTATVGTRRSAESTTSDQPTTETESLEIPENQLCVEANLTDDVLESELVEKPLDGVFDLTPSAFDQDVRYETAKDEVVEQMITVDDTPGADQPEVAAPIYEESFLDCSSEYFENTLLEAFHTPGLEPLESDTIESEEVPSFNSAPAGSAHDLELSSEYAMHTEAFDIDSVPEPVEPLEMTVEPRSEDFVVRNASSVDCPYCDQPNDNQAFTCSSCRAVLSLSDLEGLLYNAEVDHETVQNAVTQMEAEWNLRDFSDIELTRLGIGFLNLGQYGAGMKYIQEASRFDPNNVILAGQLNSLAIRLDEMRRQEEAHLSMPKGKTILVVDDSATVRKLIASKLEKSGHYVICAEDGVEALQRLDEQIPDLVLLDISMPRMDGYDVCKQIRSNPAAHDLPVVMISGKDGFFDKVRGRMAGTTGYVTKPFGPETLMKALETYLLPEQVMAD